MKALRESRSNLQANSWLCWFCVICVLTASAPSLAQSSQSPGAVETFSPQLDVAIEYRPRAGIYGITELMMAALEADISQARQLINAGASVNETDDTGSTSLMWAVHSGDVGIVRYLIAEGADVRARASQGATALINAIAAKQEAIAIELVEAGANANGRGNSLQNHLEAAAAAGMTELVDALIRNGTDIATYGTSALSYAVARGHAETTERLLRAGVHSDFPGGSHKTPILTQAAATGNRDIVQLLLSNGADASQPVGDRSPLSAAAMRGHTAVAELLIENGALVTVEDVVGAINRRNADMATVLIQHIDIEKLQPAEAASLLDTAIEHGDENVVQAISQSEPIMKIVEERAEKEETAVRLASREHAQLLFARQTDRNCDVAIWDTQSGDTRQIASLSSCPETLFASEDSDSIFVLDGSIIRIIASADPVQSSDVELPDLDYRAWLDQMTLKPNRNADYQPSLSTMSVTAVGRFDDGSLGLIANLWMPADDSYNYAFRKSGSQWTIVASVWCHRWGCVEPFSPFDFQSTNVWSWPETSMIWHENLKLNPFFATESVQSIDSGRGNYQASEYSRKFAIDGKASVLRFGTSPSEHSDTNHTFGIELAVDSAPPVQLSGNQSLTSIVGRYILVNEFFQGRFAVTDIGTGKTVIGDLKAATWLN